jgi:outer membrane protein
MKYVIIALSFLLCTAQDALAQHLKIGHIDRQKLMLMMPERKDAETTMQAMAVREIQELEQRIQAAQEKAQEDLAKQEEELLKPMVDRANAAIKDVAAANNFTYILDISTGSVLYFDKGEDILALVKAKLGIQ